MERISIGHPEEAERPESTPPGRRRTPHRTLTLGLVAAMTVFTVGCMPQDEASEEAEGASAQDQDGDEGGEGSGEDKDAAESDEESEDAGSGDGEDDSGGEDTDDKADPEEDEDGSDSSDDGSDDAQQPASDVEDSQLLMVMDASGSMEESDAGGTTRIEAAREALHGVVDGLDDSDEVGLRVFSSEVTDPEGDGACEDSELVVPIDADNREDLSDAIDSYEAVGGRTPLGHALEQAGEDLGDDGPRTIVLVSDGESNCEPDPCEVAQTLASQGIDLTIHTVGYEVEEEARAQLQCVAAAGGGEYYDAADSESLDRALERVSNRAFRPFALTGEEVDGAASRPDATELQPGGQYVDEFTEEALYYRVPRSMDLSSLHIGLTTKNDTENSDWVEARLETWDGDTCGTGRMTGQQYSTRNVLRTVQASVSADPEAESGDDPCGEEDELVLIIEFDNVVADPSSVGQAFELLIAEEPEPQNPQELPEEADYSGEPWQDMGRDAEGADDVVGGTSFNDAPLLEPGNTYDGDILPGEALVFRVPVEWGERLQAEAYFDEPSDALSDGLTSVGSMGLTMMSPLQGVVGSEMGIVPSTIATDLQVTSPTVRWNNRHAASPQVSSAVIDGDYYLVLAVDESRDGDSFAIPFRLTVQTFGEAGEGAPEYPGSEELHFPARGDERDGEDE